MTVDDFPFWEMLPSSSVEMVTVAPSAARARVDIDDGLDGEKGLTIRIEVSPTGGLQGAAERMIFTTDIRGPLNAGLAGFKSGDGYSYGAESYCLHMAAELDALAAQMRRLAVAAKAREETIE